MQVSLPRRWNPLLFILPGSSASSHHAAYRREWGRRRCLCLSAMPQIVRETIDP